MIYLSSTSLFMHNDLRASNDIIEPYNTSAISLCEREEEERPHNGPPKMVDGDGRQRARGRKKKDHTRSKEAGEAQNGGW